MYHIWRNSQKSIRRCNTVDPKLSDDDIRFQRDSSPVFSRTILSQSWDREFYEHIKPNYVAWPTIQGYSGILLDTNTHDNL